jgi:hypothetical protein
MNRTTLILGISLLFCAAQAEEPQQAGWTHSARIGGYGLEPGNAARIARAAADALVFGIEVDNDPAGRYESFLDPKEELEALRSVAREAHQAGQKVFAYTAGWECITSHAAAKEHTLAKDHPDWLQRRLTGQPAVFGEGAGFWIAKGDEDAWISPYAAQWRKLYMERIRQMAATGVDGVYVDIPYWMTHFDGWEDTWASFDEYTVKAFRERTGLDARKSFKLGDFDNPNFRRWVDFRIGTITEFMREVDRTVKSVNPDCVTIAEIYPGIEESAVSVGSDVYQLYQVVDVIAHEYEPDNNLATKKGPWSWFNYLTGICSFRAFAGGKASWMLGYSWDKNKKVTPQEPMKNLALAQVMAGANFWDARGHEMSRSNDDATRLEIFRWIRDNQARLYSPRHAMQPVGIYFSPNTRDYFADEYMQSYKGALLAAMHQHREFQIVTPRDLASFKGDMLVVADARCLSDNEIAGMRQIFDSKRSLVVTGETGRYDETGSARPASPIIQMIEKPSARGRSIYFPRCPARAYSKVVKKEFDQGGAGFPKALDEFWRQIDDAARWTPAVEVSASPYVFAQIAEVNGQPHVFLANFKGLQRDAVMEQKPELNLRIRFRSLREGHIYFTPYLGQTRELEAKKEEGGLTAILPELGKGGIVWVEPNRN